MRMIVNDVLADVNEHELGQLDDVRAHRPEWQPLHVRFVISGSAPTLGSSGISNPAG